MAKNKQYQKAAPQQVSAEDQTNEEVIVPEEDGQESGDAPVVDQGNGESGSGETGGEEGGEEAEPTPPTETPDIPMTDLEDAVIVSPGLTPATPTCIQAQTVATYAVEMNPLRHLSDKQLVNQQMELYHAIDDALRLPGDKFQGVWDEMLGVVAQHPSVFDDNNMFRGFKNLKLPQAKRDRHINMVILMISTANPAQRAMALKAIDFGTLLNGYDEQVHQNVRGYYNQR